MDGQDVYLQRTLGLVDDFSIARGKGVPADTPIHLSFCRQTVLFVPGSSPWHGGIDLFLKDHLKLFLQSGLQGWVCSSVESSYLTCERILVQDGVIALS